jgi:anti-anti-sigma factor
MTTERARPAPFDVRTLAASDGLRVVVCGELDLNTGPQLVDAVHMGLAGSAPGSVIIDLLATDFVDSSGLRALLDCRRAVGKVGARYRLCVTPGPVTRLLEVAGVTDYFDYARADGWSAARP